MANGIGTATFTSGTGSKSINSGISGNTWFIVEFRGAGIQPSVGYYFGGSQFCYPGLNDSVVTGKAIQVKDTSGTIILEGTTTGISGNNLNFNITTAPGTMPGMLIRFGS